MSYAYHIIKNGEQQGPYTFNELIRLHLDITTRVLSPAASNWEDACDVPELYSYFVGVGIYFPAKSNLASFWWRLLAYTIDSLVIGGIAYFIFYKLMPPGISDSNSLENVLIAVVVLHLFIIVYNTICETMPIKGSIGKRVCKLVVVNVDGGSIGFLRALKRNIYKILSSVMFYLGFLRVLWDEHRQAWHDEFVKAYVVRRKSMD